jgi:nicotinic acid mononucleotide adenylyltransferase
LFRKLPENVCIFKGSFNPVHNHHINLIEESEKYINGKCILEISIKNRDQNKLIEATNLLKRINILNTLGYDVIINNFGLYHYTYTNFIKHPDFKSNLYFCMGEDILDRFLKDEDGTYTNTIDYIKKFNNKWSKCTFLVHDRNDMNILIHKEIPNIIKISNDKNNISSTHIRYLIENNDIEELKKHLGEDLTNLILKEWK